MKIKISVLKPRLLDFYLFKQFIPIFFIAIFLFIFILLLIDLFANITRYLNNNVPTAVMLRICLYYIPKCISYSMPIALLFAAAYTLGDFYAKNELTAIFSTGIPIWRFSSILLVIGFIISVFSFFLDDLFVIPTLKTKKEITREALNEYVDERNTNIVIKAKGGSVVYSVDYYDIDKVILNNVIIVEIDDDGKFLSRIHAHSASWNEAYWELRNGVIFEYENDLLTIKEFKSNEKFNEHPDIFRRSAVKIEELSVKEAAVLVSDLRSLGLPYYKEQANYYQRFSFASTSFIVMLLSISMSGRFRKNIMLMSLFTSLCAAVVYYIAEMLCMMTAGLNLIPPVVGAWLPVFLFLNIGLLLLRSAKT